MSKREQYGILTFRVYPEGRRWHYDVFVWPTVSAMREHVKPHTADWRSVIACVLWPISSSDRPRRNCLGEVHFSRRHLGPDTISHEATHAALQWARKIGLVIDSAVDATETDPDEERLCEAIGTITHQIQAVLREHKILTT